MILLRASSHSKHNTEPLLTVKKRRRWTQPKEHKNPRKSPPSMEHLAVTVLEPPEALPERAFHLPLHSIDLVACNPFLPLELRVIKAPTFERRWPTTGLPFLEFHLFGNLGLWGRCIRSTVASEILQTRGRLHASIGTHLHPHIPTRFGSEIFHQREEKQRICEEMVVRDERKKKRKKTKVGALRNFWIGNSYASGLFSFYILFFRLFLALPFFMFDMLLLLVALWGILCRVQ